MSKQTKKPAKTAKKKSGVDFGKALEEKNKGKKGKLELPAHPTRASVGKYKTKQLVTSAPHYKFEKKGDSIAFKPTSKIVPAEGEFAGKLIGWNGINLDTDETVMVGNTHQIEKAFIQVNEESEKELWEVAPGFVITWNGKTGLGNGRTFNNYDIGLIEE